MLLYKVIYSCTFDISHGDDDDPFVYVVAANIEGAGLQIQNYINQLDKSVPWIAYNLKVIGCGDDYTSPNLYLPKKCNDKMLLYEICLKWTECSKIIYVVADSIEEAISLTKTHAEEDFTTCPIIHKLELKTNKDVPILIQGNPIKLNQK